MVGKKLVSVFSLVGLVTLMLSGCSTPKDELTEIGILQLVEHDALDASREGFVKALADKGFIDGENVSLTVQNAQGDIPTTQTIAKQFVSQKVDMIFAIATPAAQSAYNATKEIPILITAVTDPLEAGIVKDWNVTQTNVCGTSDMTPVAKQFDLLKTLVPTAKTVGIIYNTSEVNSEIQVELAKKAASSLGLELVTKGITSVNELSQVATALADEVDVIYAPTDNTVASGMPILVEVATEKSIPVIGSEAGMVSNGALATVGIDYFQLGYETGLMAVEVLEGKEPNTMSIQTLENAKLVVNQKTADRLGITIPEAVLKDAELITE